MPEEEALKFVTINSARQLKIENRVGSLEPGKDGDFAVWNGSPLSTYSICEQTWVDGRRFFDREENQSLVDEVTQQRATLVQKALTSKKEKGTSGEKKTSKGYYENDNYSCSHLEEGR